MRCMSIADIVWIFFIMYIYRPGLTRLLRDNNGTNLMYITGSYYHNIDCDIYVYFKHNYHLYI